MTHRPGELSGGQRQRVAVARALINNPKLLLADEPTGSLDEVTSDGIAELLIQLNRDEGVTLIVVTHSQKLAARMGRLMGLHEGRLVTGRRIMSLFLLVIRSLKFYWRTNAAVLLAVMVATGVLTGALVVGDSVQYTLRRTVEMRLGRTQFAVIPQNRYFRAALADDLKSETEGAVAPGTSGGRDHQR